MANRVVVRNSVETSSDVEGWKLCFQWCVYVYETGKTEDGFRFIWKRPNGSLQPARGQARIPSVKILHQLLEKAEADGWLHNSAEDASSLEE